MQIIYQLEKILTINDLKDENCIVIASREEFAKEIEFMKTKLGRIFLLHPISPGLPAWILYTTLQKVLWITFA